ncbi:MAG: hypothetical protein QF906_05460 [Dehalococcoidales bacterium]|nr:hypothetical protein [Dehalococcoidales bacterium]
MRKEIAKIWGVGLTAILVASLLLAAVPMAQPTPASAGTLGWGAETIPSTTGKVLIAGANITDMDVCTADPDIIWAVADVDSGAGNGTYKSTDAGVTWTKITNHTGVGTAAGTGVQLVAVAPDDPDIVVVIADAKEVYATTNGGTTWGDLTTPNEASTTVNDAATNIYDVDISHDDAGVHYVGVAGIDSAANDASADAMRTGNVWYFNMGAAAPSWIETNDKTGFGATGTNVSTAMAVAFSPSFASDKVMVAVTANVTGAVNFEMWSMSSAGWNESGASFTSYPVSLVANADATIATPRGLYAADISLSPDYLGSDDSMRVAFVGLTVQGSTAKDGIYRLKDTGKKEMKVGIDVNSVSYDGTNLVAGEFNSNVSYYCADPLASSPTVSTTAALKRAGGDARTITRWAGVDVLTGTSGTSSSFNVSRDNGKSYNGISLVDISTSAGDDSGTNDINDVAVSADGTKIYLSADDGTNLSLWRGVDGVWERVAAIDSVANAIVRLAPDDPDAVYTATTGASKKTIYYSSAGGDTKWFMRSSRYDVKDIAVESTDVCYVAVNAAGSVSKSTNSGFTWGTAKDGQLFGGTNVSIHSFGEDQLLHTSTTGYVSYSIDGNTTWVQIKKQVNSTSGTIHVTASGLNDGDFIYAASQTADLNVRRWEVGTSTSWGDIISGTLATDRNADDDTSDTGETFLAYGAELIDGVLYIVGVDDAAADSSLFRTLSPSTAASTSTWSNKLSGNADDEALTLGFSSSTSDGNNKLWGIEPGDDQLFSFVDTLHTLEPELTGPADGTEIDINAVSGVPYNVAFSWSRPSTANRYSLEISLDDGFFEDVTTETIPSATTTTTTATPAKVLAGTNFNEGTTYYWRVRVASNGPVYSPYSETRSFTVKALPAPPAAVVIKPAPAPIVRPEVVVPTPTINLPAPVIEVPTPTINLPAPVVNIPAPQEVIIPPAPAPAPAVPTVAIYAIIIIGALLVIALIILIMRTRRPI